MIKLKTSIDYDVYGMYARDGYDKARALLRTLSQDELITVMQREHYANELAKLEIMLAKNRYRELKDMGF